MKHTFIIHTFGAIIIMAICSCSSTQTITGGASPSSYVDLYTGSHNELNLIVASEPITYTIDISTTAGQSKLKGLSLQEAEGLVLREAVMSYRSAKIVDPQFTYLTKGRRVLRITVYGFPAKYKNQ